MKHIIKGDEPTNFVAWKARPKSDGSQRTFADLCRNSKKIVKSALTQEQYGICCYCERKLYANDSHIEHLQPQSLGTVDPLDFSNMLCSCLGDIPKGAPRHCGMLKDNWYDADNFISPLDTDCEQCFTFTGDGHIHPVGLRTEAAKETISRLGLDIPKLVDMRNKAIDIFLDEDLEPSDFNNFVVGYLKETAEGNFNEFWTTIKHLFARELAV